jgi:hypothetical protein
MASQMLQRFMYMNNNNEFQLRARAVSLQATTAGQSIRNL